jgi:hypothetical protein
MPVWAEGWDDEALGIGRVRLRFSARVRPRAIARLEPHRPFGKLKTPLISNMAEDLFEERLAF